MSSPLPDNLIVTIAEQTHCSFEIGTTEEAHCIFDIALHSSHPTVQSALDVLLTVTRLAHAEEIACGIHTLAESIEKYRQFSREDAHKLLDHALTYPNYDTLLAWVNFVEVLNASERRRYRDQAKRIPLDHQIVRRDEE